MISPTLTPKDCYLALFLVMLMLFLGSWYMVAGVSGVCHDNELYVSTAKPWLKGRAIA